MTKRRYIFALDVGTSSLKSLVGEIFPNFPFQVIAMDVESSAGLRRGQVVDVEEAAKSIRKNLEEIERKIGQKVDTLICNIGGPHIEYTVSRGVVAVSRADGRVTEEDVSRAIKAAEAISLPPNKEIIHILPRQFILDKEGGIKDPVGMEGVRLEVECGIIYGSSSYIKNLERTIESAGAGIEDLIFSGASASEAVLSKRQKELGALLLDIGGGSTTLSVWEEGNLIHAAVLPIGSSHITNDIAIAFQLPLDLAEKVKLKYGSASPFLELRKKERINLEELEEKEAKSILRKDLMEVIEARISEIADLVNLELKKIGRQRLLPAGIVLTGGGAKMPGFVEFMKRKIHLPCQIGFPMGVEGIVDKIDDPAFANAIGLLIWSSKRKKGIIGGGKGKFLPGLNKIRKWLEELMP